MTDVTDRRARLIGWGLVVAWLVSRAFLAYSWRTTSAYIVGDVRYYFSQVSHAVTWSSALVEYPTPVAWAMHGLMVITNRNQGAFIWGFTTSMAVLDAVMAWQLWRSGGRFRGWATASWIVFVVCLGPLAYFRFDMAPAMLAGVAALWVNRRPGRAGILIAAGAALKLWPALLVLPLVGKGTKRRRSLVAFAVTGFVLALASLIIGGWRRLLSPLTWQADRGLQVESLPATPLMWLRTFSGSTDWQVGLSRFNAYEISGPGVAQAQQVANIAFVAGLIVIGVLGLRAVRMSNRTVQSVAMVMLAIVMVMIVTNKTLSPQYILWIGGPVTALIAGIKATEPRLPMWPTMFVVSAWLLAITTQVVYPLSYSNIVFDNGQPAAVAVLVLRNVALALYAVATVVAAWVLTQRRRVETSAR